MIESLLTPSLFAFLLVFTRVGTGMMFLPGIAESYVSPTVRLALALLIALVMAYPLSTLLPKAPGSPLMLAYYMGAEALIGTFIGMLCRLLLSVLHVGGTIVSMQSGLSAAVMFDTTQASQGTLLGNLLSMSGLAFWFAMDFHHLALSALFDSYTLFEPGQYFPLGDGVEMYSKLLSSCFAMALQITAPIVMVMLLINLGGGILARLMPQMQVFYLLLPLQILTMLFLLSAISSGFFTTYLGFIEDRLMALLHP
jgi:flagellar biosynthetic protein FliR